MGPEGVGSFSSGRQVRPHKFSVLLTPTSATSARWKTFDGIYLIYIRLKKQTVLVKFVFRLNNSF